MQKFNNLVCMDLENKKFNVKAYFIFNLYYFLYYCFKIITNKYKMFII